MGTTGFPQAEWIRWSQNPRLDGAIMKHPTYLNRRGLTVLALVLLILALAVGAFFLIPYLQSL